MKCIIRYLRPFYAIMALGLSIKVLATMVELALPYILRHILDNVVPQASVEKIVLWGLLMIVCAALAMIGSVTANRMASKVARNAARAIRHDLFDKTMHLTARQTDRFTIPSLESRLTSDTYHVHNFIERIQRLGVRAPILLVGGLILTATLDVKLTLVMVAVMPFLAISVYLISKQGVPLYTKVQSSQDRMIRVVREDAQGIRVIKALSKTEYEKRRFEGYNHDLSRTERRAGTIMAASNPTMNLFLNLGLTAVIFVGALLISNNSGTKPGVIIAFMQYFTLLSNALLGITRLFVMYTRSAASANRIAEVLQTENDLPLSSEKDFPFRREEGYLVFDHVNFSYNGTKNNLTDIHFSLPQGKTLGIIGFGQIGRAVGKIANAFGMHVLAYNRSQCDEGRTLGDYVDLDTLLTKSDVISLHCPLTEETEELINAATLNKMKDGAILLNTARGGLVNENAVVSALKAGKLLGFAADVVSFEPIMSNNPLLSAPNCILTPHMAWAPVEARQRIIDTTVQNIQSFLNCQPINIVNP